MSFIPAFPYYFCLRSVCSQWLYEFEEHLYRSVTYLDLVDDGRPKFYMRDDKQLVQFKPIGGTGKCLKVSSATIRDMRNYNRTSIFEFLGHVFPKVTHLRLGLGSFFNQSNFGTCVKVLLPQFRQLETLDILGTRQSYSVGRENMIREYQLEAIASCLPRSTKNLNLIALSFPQRFAWDEMKIFSRKGRTEHGKRFSRVNGRQPIKVDIQSLTITYAFLNQLNGFNSTTNVTRINWQTFWDIYSRFEVSIVASSNTIPPQPSITIVSPGDYVNHMSKKEGIFLSHIVNRSIEQSEELLEATVDSVVREYPYFEPLLCLSEREKVFQLTSQTTLGAPFFFENIMMASKTLGLLMDPIRMKYPQLVLDVNGVLGSHEHEPPYTILNHLIKYCTSEATFSVIKTLVEDYKVDLAVNNVLNCVCAMNVNHNPDLSLQKKLIKYLISQKPELISLGNLEGVINDDQKDHLLLQYFVSSADVEVIQCLVESGASLTNVEKDGNNIIHLVCRGIEFNTLKYLFSKCPPELMFARNYKNITPLEKVFQVGTSEDSLIQFLEQVGKLHCFSTKGIFQHYPTSCGSLLHVAMSAKCKLTTIQWFIDHGFDANSMNDNGENPLFYSFQSNQASDNHDFNLIHQDQLFIDEIAEFLIRNGARIDIQNNKGNTVITTALYNNNYRMINNLIQNPSISSKSLAELLGPRMENGLNALHLLVRTLVTTSDNVSSNGSYTVARHCALLCLKHYPEMLHELSETSNERLKDISGLSPLQLLLRSSNSLHVLGELTIKLNDIANMPVYTSKASNIVAHLPAMYLALEQPVNIPMFDKLMSYSENVFLIDESQLTKPNLLQIGAEKGASLCKCILKHWKKRCGSKEELCQLIRAPMENDNVDGRRARNAAIIACAVGCYETFVLLWPYTIAHAEHFDDPVRIALANNHYDFALSAVVHHGIVPCKDQLHDLIRWCLCEKQLSAVNENRLISRMVAAEKIQPKPSWLELMIQMPEQTDDVESLSTLQLLVCEKGNDMFDWLVSTYCNDPLLNQIKAMDPRTGNTLLHLLKNSAHTGKELSPMFSAVIRLFRSTESPNVDQIKGKYNDLNMIELAKFINIQNKCGRTCLHNVAVNNHLDILQHLLHYGANTEIRESNGKTPVDLMDYLSARHITFNFFESLDKEEEKRISKKKKRCNKSDDERTPQRRGRKKRRTVV